MSLCVSARVTLCRFDCVYVFVLVKLKVWVASHFHLHRFRCVSESNQDADCVFFCFFFVKLSCIDLTFRQLFPCIWEHRLFINFAPDSWFSSPRKQTNTNVILLCKNGINTFGKINILNTYSYKSTNNFCIHPLVQNNDTFSRRKIKWSWRWKTTSAFLCYEFIPINK